MIIVYDAKGNQHFHHHPVDAKEAIKTGRFFAHNPLKEVPPPPPPPTLKVGEDIELEQTGKQAPELETGLKQKPAEEPEQPAEGATSKRRK